MLIWIRRRSWLALVIATGSVLALLFFGSLFIDVVRDICEKNEYTGVKECASHHLGPFAILWIAEFIDAHNGVVTALATLVMAGFTGTLWWSTSNTAKLTEKTVDLAEKQFLMEGRQADLAEKQHGLVRLQHIAANKPLLRIRSIVLFPPFAGATSYFIQGSPIKGSLVIANSGATDATIIDSGYRFYWAADRLPMRPPLDQADVTELLLTDAPIVGYGSRGVVVESKEVLPQVLNTFDSRIASGPRLYLMGFIHYADINGAERFMGFCRQYDTSEAWSREGRFVPVNNSDYEYSD